MNDLSGMVKQSMGSTPSPGAEDPLIARILASTRGVPAGQPQQSLNPYEAGLRQDPANMGNAGRLEPGSESRIQKLVMEALAQENPDFKVSADLPAAQYPQQVKQPPVR